MTRPRLLDLFSGAGGVLSLIATAAAALGGLIVVIHYAITAKEPKR